MTDARDTLSPAHTPSPSPVPSISAAAIVAELKAKDRAAASGSPPVGPLQQGLRELMERCEAEKRVVKGRATIWKPRGKMGAEDGVDGSTDMQSGPGPSKTSKKRAPPPPSSGSPDITILDPPSAPEPETFSDRSATGADNLLPRDGQSPAQPPALGSASASTPSTSAAPKKRLGQLRGQERADYILASKGITGADLRQMGLDASTDLPTQPPAQRRRLGTNEVPSPFDEDGGDYAQSEKATKRVLARFDQAFGFTRTNQAARLAKLKLPPVMPVHLPDGVIEWQPSDEFRAEYQRLKLYEDYFRFCRRNWALKRDHPEKFAEMWEKSPKTVVQ